MKLKTTIGIILLASFALAFAASADAATAEDQGFEIAANAAHVERGEPEFLDQIVSKLF